MLRVEVIENEKAYLAYIASLYEKEPGHLEYLAYVFGFKKRPQSTRQRHQIRITKADFKTINSLLHYLDEENPDADTIELLKKTYERGCNRSTGLPVWVIDSTLYNQLPANTNPLPEKEIHFMDKLSEGGDRIKRFSDLAEDSITSATRMPDGLVDIPDNIVRGTAGGTNIGNTIFEFIKAWWDARVAYKKKDAEFRPENLADAGMRISLSSIGITVCALYLAGILVTSFALAFIAIVTLPIYILPFLKNGFIFWNLRKKHNESKSQAYSDEHGHLTAQLESLGEELKELQKNIEHLNNLEPGLGKQHITYGKRRNDYFAIKYQLASMHYRMANDKTAYLEAKHDFIMSAIELGGYTLVATGSFLGLAIFLNPAGPIVASIAFAAAVSGVAIITACKFLPSIIAKIKRLIELIKLAAAEIEFAIEHPHEFLEKILVSIRAAAGLIAGFMQKGAGKILALLSGKQDEAIPQDAATTLTTSTMSSEEKPPGVIRKAFNTIKSAIRNFSPYSKGNHYWSLSWDEGPGTSTIKAYQFLERYAHSGKSTHGKAVREEYYRGNIQNTAKATGCSGAVAIIKKALNNKPVKDKGDLHKILQVFGEKDGEDYLSQFMTEKRPSIAESISSFFHFSSRNARKREHKQPLLEKHKNGFTRV